MTDDFAVFTNDEDLGNDLIASVRFVAPATAIATLEAKGLLPGSIENLLPDPF